MTDTPILLHDDMVGLGLKGEKVTREAFEAFVRAQSEVVEQERMKFHHDALIAALRKIGRDAAADTVASAVYPVPDGKPVS